MRAKKVGDVGAVGLRKSSRFPGDYALDERIRLQDLGDFFSHDGQLRPRQENGQRTLVRHVPHQRRAKP